MLNLLTSPPAPKAPLRHFWTGLNSSGYAAVLARLLLSAKRSALIITPDVASAERVLLDMNCFLAGHSDRPRLLVFSDWETLPYDTFSPHQDIVSDRLRALYELSFEPNTCVIAAAQTAVQRVVPTDYVKQKSLVVKTNTTLNRGEFTAALMHSGYVRVDTVYQHGEFAIRGSLLDVFPMGSESAYRIELFDDEIESLREFDPDTQRTTQKVQYIEVLPGRECPLDTESIARFKSNWHERFDTDPRQCPLYQDVKDGHSSAGIEYYLPLFFEHTATLFDYLPENSLIVTLPGFVETFERHLREINHRYESRRGDLSRPILAPESIYLNAEEFFSRAKTFARIELSNDAAKEKTGHFDLRQNTLPLVELDAQANNALHRLESFLSQTSHRIAFCVESEGRREVLKEQLEKITVDPEEFICIQDFLASNSDLAIVVAPIEHGLRDDQNEIMILAENMIFGNRVQQRRRRKKTIDESESIVKNLAELKTGAAVVHLEHGVGRYRGLQTIEHNDLSEEFLVIEYANEAKLYVPVPSLHLISRYSGAEESLAPLHKLGNEQWQKAKKKAAERIHDVAAELLHIYAQRKSKKGFIHELKKDDYDRFAEEFPFEETADQSIAIQAVRADMLSPQPMDRLVCGDVGFGKTEVAMRAAFIAVQNSKQIAVLVPTTLLAQQHYENFKDRFANWPVTIDVLSRFKSTKETNEAIKKIASGKTDIVIGTHKLIMGDIKYKNLGLVIIDEEHRFGVKQKEALKSIRAEVDILNLTATPIPRTLNMAMSGIRDLSIIATPPAKRLSVKTFVREQDPALIKEAILREIMRGGQVYYLHNEVKTIEKTAADLAKLVPEAKIRVGHGQMRERELEAVMSDFYHKRFNILVCTTIIETGIDVPTANTIIIDRADKLGLAQLHQLRGRVGRSHHQAYAYLLSPNKRNLTADAVKRLDAIEEAQDLGAGFMLASHDLEIRGAGELLGEEQSGQIHAIGFTLYMEMLDRAVEAIKKGEKLDLNNPFDHETEINLRIPALIPDDYLPDISVRLSLYKRLTGAKNDEELEKLQVELIDRFGLLPEPLKNLFRLTRLRFKANELGIAKIEASDRGGKIEFAPDTKVAPLAIVKLVQNQPQLYKLNGANQLQFSRESKDAHSRLTIVTELLETLREN